MNPFAPRNVRHSNPAEQSIQHLINVNNDTGMENTTFLNKKVPSLIKCKAT